MLPPTTIARAPVLACAAPRGGTSFPPMVFPPPVYRVSRCTQQAVHLASLPNRKAILTSLDDRSGSTPDSASSPDWPERRARRGVPSGDGGPAAADYDEGVVRARRRQGRCGRRRSALPRGAR